MVWSPLAQGWLTGKWRQGKTAEGTHRQNLQPHLFEMARPENKEKLRLVEELRNIAGNAGVSLMGMALAFAANHPAVASVIIGPRTFDQLRGLLDCSDIELSEDVLDAIDELVPPGTNISSDDDGYTAPEIQDKYLRRRERRSRETNAGGQTMENIENYKKKKQ